MSPFSFSISRGESDTFQVATDLGDRLKISELETHRIIERGLIGVVALTQTLGEMKAYPAISGFRDEELPLFGRKLDFLAETASSQAKEDSFQRVIDIAELPDVLSDEGKINVEILLKIRDSSEGREFRDWLGGIGGSSDEEIRQRICGLRAKAGLATNRTLGKAMRFLVTTGLSLIPHTLVPSVGLSAFDQFVLDKVLPRSGIAAFVNELYPSIFGYEP